MNLVGAGGEVNREALVHDRAVFHRRLVLEREALFDLLALVLIRQGRDEAAVLPVLRVDDLLTTPFLRQMTNAPLKSGRSTPSGR